MKSYRYICKLIIFPITPALFTVLWLLVAGYNQNISVLLSMPTINIIPNILCVISLMYIHDYFKKNIPIKLRYAFLISSLLTLIFPYIHFEPIRNLHLLFAYTAFFLYYRMIHYADFSSTNKNYFYSALIFCFLDCAIHMQITGLSEIIFLWTNAYILSNKK